MNKPNQPYFDDQGQLHQLDALELDFVWVPTQQVNILTLFVPGKRRSQWQAALPYAIEELIAEPLESVHLVPLQRDDDGQVTVAVVSKVRMQNWLNSLQQAGITKAQLVADCFALPVPTTDWFSALSFTTPDWICVRSGIYSGLALPIALLDSIKELVGSKIEARSNDYQVLDKDFLHRLGLRSGEFALEGQTPDVLKNWLWPSLLAGLVVMLLFAHASWKTAQLEQQALIYQQQTTQLFKTLFPHVQRVVNIQVQTQTYLKQSVAAGANQGPAKILDVIEPLLSAHKSIKAGSADWQNGQLNLRVTAPNPQGLEQLVNDLTPQLAISLQIQQVSADKVEGVLHVRPK